MLNKKQIGSKIKEARAIKSRSLGRRYTGQHLSDELNISRSFLGDIESGRKPAPEYILENILKICNLEADFFEDKTEENDFQTNNTFTSAGEAMKFILSQPVIMGYGGFDVNKMSSEELIEFANDLLHQLKLLSYKYKK